jgi:hypothetical protein
MNMETKNKVEEVVDKSYRESSDYPNCIVKYDKEISNEDFFKWEVPDISMEVLLLGLEKRDEETVIATVQKLGQTEIFKFFCPTVLAGKLKRVEIDNVCRIVYHGLKQSEKNKAQKYHDFSVYKGEVISK